MLSKTVKAQFDRRFFDKFEAKKFDSVNLAPSLLTAISPKIPATVNRAALPVTTK